MLTYSLRKQNRSDPVREILARIEEKQSKTGLSLYAGRDEPQSYCLPSEECPYSGSIKSSFFPDMKAAREKAQSRITTNFSSDQAPNSTKHFPTRKTKRAPHRLPNGKKDGLGRAFPPSSVRGGAGLGEEKTNNIYNPNDVNINKDSIDININPFGYNRKTLAFDKRNINYVVEWPETWPFKITEIQQPCPHKHFTSAPVSNPTPEELPWQHVPGQARVLAPVDPPSKPHPLPNKPFLESVRRQFRKPQSRDSKESFYQTYCKEAGLSYKQEGLPGNAMKRRRSISEEEPKPSLPVPNPSRGGTGTSAARGCSPAVSSVDDRVSSQLLEGSTVRQNSPLVDNGIQKQDSRHSNEEHAPPSTPVLSQLKEESPETLAKDVLNDIVNQILKEDDGILI